MTDSVLDAGNEQTAPVVGPTPASSLSANAPGGVPGALAVEAIDMTKRFPGVVANDHVSFQAAAGEVHALLGENGAGKTTLCNLLMGLYRPDEGKLFIGGRAVRFHSPKDAQDVGIFMVHQHLRLVESMTVAENVVLGWSKPRKLRFAPRSVEKAVAEAADRFQMPVDPRARIWQLSLGERQRVEILKALYRGARILILDEPTTVLTPQETDQLFSSVRDMAAAGRTVIFISHKLPEVLAVADRVTILRQGRSITTVPTAGTDADQLAGLMVGREVSLEATAKLTEDPGPVVLELQGVSRTRRPRHRCTEGRHAPSEQRRDPRHRRRRRQWPTQSCRGHHGAASDHGGQDQHRRHATSRRAIPVRPSISGLPTCPRTGWAPVSHPTFPSPRT